jgi:RNA exonuclease 4
VDEHERVLCNLYVRPEGPVVSYLTPLTGLSRQLLDQHGMPLAHALAVLQQCLPNTAVLVGQNVAKDVEWLGLKEGQHYEQVACGWLA